MPAYEYRCKDCQKEFTVFLSLREYASKPKIICPHCKSDHSERIITGFFVKTDSKT
jgi:putative FmdB family regulatory protein